MNQRKWRCKYCAASEMKTANGLGRHYANIHYAVWEKESGDIRPMTKEEKGVQQEKRKQAQSRAKAHREIRANRKRSGSSTREKSDKKIPSAEMTGAVALGQVSRSRKLELQKKYAKWLPVQKMIIGSASTKSSPTCRQKTRPMLAGTGVKTSTAKNTKVSMTLTAPVDDLISIGSISSTTPDDSPVGKKVVGSPSKKILVGDTISAQRISDPTVAVKASVSGPTDVVPNEFLNIDDSSEEDTEALKGTLPYCPGLPRVPQASERTVQYIRKFGVEMAMSKLEKTIHPKKLSEAEEFYYSAAYGLIAQTAEIVQNLK